MLTLFSFWGFTVKPRFVGSDRSSRSLSVSLSEIILDSSLSVQASIKLSLSRLQTASYYTAWNFIKLSEPKLLGLVELWFIRAESQIQWALFIPFPIRASQCCVSSVSLCYDESNHETQIPHTCTVSPFYFHLMSSSHCTDTATQWPITMTMSWLFENTPKKKLVSWVFEEALLVAWTLLI